MREAIEKVIADLDQRKFDARMMRGSQRGTLSAEGYGRYMELDLTIVQLEEVLREHEPDPKGEQHPS